MRVYTISETNNQNKIIIYLLTLINFKTKNRIIYFNKNLIANKIFKIIQYKNMKFKTNFCKL